MSPTKKTFIMNLMILAIFVGGLFLKDYIYPPNTTGPKINNPQSAVSQKRQNELKIIPTSKVLYEYKINALRATEKYGNTPSKIIGVFDSVQRDKYGSDNGILITIMESWRGNSIYAILPQSQRKNIIDMDNGTLISINCMGLDSIGSSPLFKKCDILEKVDTKGESPEIYLDKLVYEHNILLNPQKD